VNVRRALPADEGAISDLALGAARQALHAPWDDLLGALQTSLSRSEPRARRDPAASRIYDLFVAEVSDQIGCLWASVVEPPKLTQLWALIVHDDWPMRETLRALLGQIKPDLRRRGVASIAFVGLERWLLDGLAANGFAREETVITMQKGDWSIPSSGNRQAIVRPATGADLKEILAIDEQAFVPLWRNTIYTLSEHLQAMDYFVVSELGGSVAGYAYASLAGRHGHLTRLAVHPQYQGQHVAVHLLAEVIRFFRREHVFGITLNTQQSNARARRLYEWFGFAALGRETEVWACHL
jgi:ribosomal protein S18 acetylase RimI-like enzyme